MTMRDEILALVDRRRNVSFVELNRLINGFRGDRVLALERWNIVLWQHISAEGYEALKQLRDEKMIEYVPASMGSLIYLIDGVVLNMPTVKRMPKRPYKKPRWLPVVINPTAAGSAAAQNLEVPPND